MSVLTEEFRSAFESQRSAIGLDAAAVYVPHPIQNKTREELHALATGCSDTVLTAIVQA